MERIHIIHTRVTDSTNAETKRLARGEACVCGFAPSADGSRNPPMPEGTVVIADAQSGGRGRLSKPFLSPPDCGLYMSVLLRPKLRADETICVTTAAAVAVCRAIERLLGISPGIKWINDLLLNGKKFCGILSEAVLGEAALSVTSADTGAIATDKAVDKAVAAACPDFAVLGIGINLCDPPGGYPEELRDRVCSLGVGFERRDALALAILEAFLPIYDALPDKAYMAEYEARRVDNK